MIPEQYLPGAGRSERREHLVGDLLWRRSGRIGAVDREVIDGDRDLGLRLGRRNGRAGRQEQRRRQQDALQAALASAFAGATKKASA